ncbi:hypothetical protein D3C78_1797870 [compost metagenome]
MVGEAPSSNASQPLIRRYSTQTTVAIKPIHPIKMYTAMPLMASHNMAHQNVRSIQSKWAA